MLYMIIPIIIIIFIVLIIGFSLNLYLNKKGKKADARGIKFLTIIIIIIFFIVLFINISFWKIWNPFPHQEFEIKYYYDNSNESEAINKSEQLDYNLLFNKPRYNQTWDYPNYIDDIVIDDYIEEYKNTNENYDKWFKYKSKAIQIKNSTINYFVTYKSEKYEYWDSERNKWGEGVDYIPVHNLKISKNEEIIYEYNDKNLEVSNPIIISNTTGEFIFLNINNSFLINDHSGFIIKMSLSYGFVGGPLYGWGIDIIQIILFDLNYEPIWIYVDGSSWES